jgi:hypothetical protein
LLREAGLYVDETPKHQVANPTVDNHVIVDSETGMRIHLSLNRIFSSFPTRALTLEEIEDRDTYPIVFITPDSIAWDPYASHYAENEAAMLDSNGLIVEHDTQLPQVLFTEANLCKLYGEPVTWDEFNNAIDKVFASKDEILGCPLTNDEVVKLNHGGICAKLTSIDISYKPRMFAATISEQAHISHVSMALGSVSIDDTACDIFIENASAMLTTAFATIAAVSAGRSKGVNADHLAKVWCIPHDDAAWTIQATSQLLRHDLDFSLSSNVGTNDRAVQYKKIKSYFFLIRSL